MGKIPQHVVDEINNKADLAEVIGKFIDLSGRGADLKGNCPVCGGKKKFSVNARKKIWKCFGGACPDTTAGNTATSFLTRVKGMNYRDALKWLADYYHIFWEDEDEKTVAPKKIQPLEPIPHTAQRRREKSGEQSKPFRDQQLAESGLEEADQKLEIITGPDTRIEIDRYVSATLNERYEVEPGDDMLMRYVTLDRKLITFMPKGGRKERDFYRMRWQNPSLHKDRNGDPMKYQSPVGSGSRLWFPSRFISLFESGKEFETVAIHEGEKKADKAMKHGLASIGIMGINNLAVNNRLPHEMEMIVKRGVKNIIFVIDADFRDLGRNVEKSADSRPRSFLKAVYNFQQHFFAFNNSGIFLNIYLSYVKKNAAGEKGIDDLLTGSMKGKEDEVIRSIYATMNLQNGEGPYLDVHNITSWSYHKLLEFFHLQNVHEFGRYYKKQLQDQDRKVFRFGRELWRFGKDENGDEVVELAQPIGENEKFWDERKIRRRDGPEEDILRFNYRRCYLFLNKRGFGRYKTFEGKKIYVRLEQNIVREVEREEVKSYITEFSEQLDNETLLNLLYAGGTRYFSEDSLSNLKFVDPRFQESQKGVQYMFFSNCYWKVTAEGIIEAPINDLDGHVWSNQIAEHSVNRLEPMVQVEFIPTEQQLKELNAFAGEQGGYIPDYSQGMFSMTTSLDGDRCHFLNFFKNTSNFFKEKTFRGEPFTEDEGQECIRHFLQKCTAFGYLLHTHHDSRVTKAVIAMDAKLSEVGASEGRSGKSLLGRGLQKLLPTVYIPGKQRDLTEDRFLLEEVQPGRTKVLWIDDVRVNFDFEFFFPFITGGAKYETKGIRRTTLPPEQTPKLYICTNHAINEQGGSFGARMVKLAFSDWYFDNGQGHRHTPLDDFGISFFDEWEFDQWNLFFNFSAFCLQLYFQYGLIPAPNDRLELRRLRQFIGEIFLDWADEYFGKQDNRNREIPREEFNNAFYEKHDDQRRKGVDTRRVKQKLVAWCQYRHFLFNPGYPSKDGKQHGGDIKKGGIEYFLIADEKYQGKPTASANNSQPNLF